MNYKKSLLLLIMLSLTACSSSKKDTQLSENENSSIYALPSSVDYEKAAKLNIELGLNYLNQGEIARAKGKLTRAKSLAPNLSEVHYAYGYFQERIGEVKDAEKSYQKAVSINPKGGNEHNNYGAFLCRQHQYRQAEKEFNKALDDPNYLNTAEALENAGLCVLQIPDIAKATDYFQKALRHDPSRQNALIEMAVLEYKAGKMSFAQEYLHRYMQHSKPNARSLLLGIEIARYNGDKDKESSYRLLLNSQYPNAKLADLYQSSVKS